LADYAAVGEDISNASGTVIVGVHHIASPVTQPLITEFVVGSPDDAANGTTIRLDFDTTAMPGGTTGGTPAKIRPWYPAADAQVATNGTLIAAPDAILFAHGLNQRVPFRWVAQPGREPSFTATVDHGIYLEAEAPASGSYDMSGTIWFSE